MRPYPHFHDVGMDTSLCPLIICCLCDLLGRPTEIPESDVFICESRYNEDDKEIRRYKGLKVGNLVWSQLIVFKLAPSCHF